MSECSPSKWTLIVALSVVVLTVCNLGLAVVNQADLIKAEAEHTQALQAKLDTTPAQVMERLIAIEAIIKQHAAEERAYHANVHAVR